MPIVGVDISKSLVAAGYPVEPSMSGWKVPLKELGCTPSGSSSTGDRADGQGVVALTASSIKQFAEAWLAKVAGLD